MIQPNPDFSASGVLSESSECESGGDAATPSARPQNVELIDLVRRANASDPKAQAELVRRYTRRIAGFVRAIIRQPEAVEDVTQIVLIKMFRRLGRLRDPGVFEAWLFTMARNTSLDFIRRRNCRPTTVALDEDVNQIADPSNATATTEILAALDRALVRLSPLDRSLVTQFVAGETYSDIATGAGLSLATVKVRLHRVRPFLRCWIGEMTDTRRPNSKGWRGTSGPRATAPWPETSRGGSLRVAA